jgi:hypothetical protein
MYSVGRDITQHKKSAQTLSFDVAGLFGGLTISKAFLKVKTSGGASDASALISKTVTSSATSSGQITNTGDAFGKGAFYFIIDELDADAMTVGTIYTYAIKLKMSDGNYYLLPDSVGKFIVKDAYIEDVSS